MISINLQLQSVVHLFLSVYRWIQFTGFSSFCQKQCLVIFQNFQWDNSSYTVQRGSKCRKCIPKGKLLQSVPASSTGTTERVQSHKWQPSVLPGRTSQTSGKISRKLLRNHQETNSGHVREEVIIALFLGVCYKFDLHKLKLLQLSYFPNNYNLIS